LKKLNSNSGFVLLDLDFAAPSFEIVALDLDFVACRLDFVAAFSVYSAASRIAL
jgi:hypothetical protein